MSDMSSKIKKIPDFFVTSVIPLTIKQQEFEIKVGIFGAIEIQGSQIIPKVSGYKILEVNKQKQKIIPTKEIIEAVNFWIKNNPMKFDMLVTAELKIMTMLT